MISRHLKVQIIAGFIKLIIEHYPNYFGLIKQFKIVNKAIEAEVKSLL